MTLCAMNGPMRCNKLARLSLGFDEPSYDTSMPGAAAVNHPIWVR
jgi:hypothetical protein